MTKKNKNPSVGNTKSGDEICGNPSGIGVTEFRT
jgi:hypothetical protein